MTGDETTAQDGQPHSPGMRNRAEPVWARPDPGARRPRHTRDQIADAALAIADAEGIEAVTMRRVATELGAGTMTLYHYVRSKAELTALMYDAIMAEQLVREDELLTDWRQALTAIATRARNMMRRHPWVAGLQSGGGGGGAGPHGLRHFEQSLAAVATTGLPVRDRLDLIGAIDDYVAGFVLKSDLEPGIESVPAEAAPAISAYLDEQLRIGHYPHIEALLGDGDRWATLSHILTSGYTPDQRFENGLKRLLDGVAQHIQRHSTLDPPA